MVIANVDKVLNDAPFASTKHAAAMFEAAFDATGTKLLGWFKVQQAIHKHHDSHERR